MTCKILVGGFIVSIRYTKTAEFKDKNIAC